MAERINTGGNVSFVYPKGYSPKKDKEFEDKIEAALRRARAKKRKMNLFSSAKKIEDSPPEDYEVDEQLPKRPTRPSENEDDVNWIKWVVIVLIILGLLWVSSLIFSGQHKSANEDSLPKCSDGTPYDQCSSNKPYYCYQGTLVETAATCGCPVDSIIDFQTCKKILKCSDGTIYNKCSSNKPLYCNNGTLIDKATQCGCNFDETKKGNSCFSPASATIKNLAQNGEDYYGMSVRLSGKLSMRGGGYTLSDNEGYWIWIGSNSFGGDCLESNRDYDFFSGTVSYSAEGIFTEPEECTQQYGCWDFKYNPRLICSSPLQ